MPYFAHITGLEPTFGHMFEDKAAAHTYAHGQTPKLDVTYKASDDEREHWRERERSRFDSAEYQPVPWKTYLKVNTYDWSTDPVTTIERLDGLHNVHMSIKSPGMVAYTPTEEHGYADRQIVVKPGKYLTEFYADTFSKAQIDEYVAQVKGAYSAAHIATTADDIEAVYTNGPNSCMSHHEDDYQSSCHPVRVYGDSDLAVAYLGELDRRVSARSVIWPEKKIYTRVYGDTALTKILERDGYSEGTLEGAYIRAIESRNGSYVMPYIDYAEGATLVRRKSDEKLWFRLTDHDTDYCVKNTDGLATEAETYSCEHCGDSCDEGETYCSSCEDERYSCERCGDCTWELDDFTEVETRYGRVYMCESCASRDEHTCDACEETWFSQTHTGSLCRSCEDTHGYCDDCGDCTHVDKLDEENRCEDCRPDETEDETEDSTEDTPDVPTVPTIPACPVPTPFVHIKLNTTGEPIAVECLHRCGRLAVHAGYQRTGYTVSHTLTGLSVTTVRSRETANRIAHRLATEVNGRGWEFTTREDIPQDTRRIACTIVDEYASERV